MSRIFVTGMGSISAIGNSVTENHRALLKGKCGIGPLEMFPTRYASLLPFGEIKLANTFLQEKLQAHEPELTRTTLLALHAFEEAIADAQLSPQLLKSFDTALIGATTVGGMCLTDELYRDANKTENGSAYLSSYDCASVNMYLQKRYGINGIINTINTACSSSANAILYGARLIKNGWAERAIVGGVDSLAKFTINGFNSLHILSPDICTPFDEQRKGLNLGEAAAFLVLEKEEAVAGKRCYAELTGYCNTNDAFHASSLSEEGDGPYLSMKGALDMAGILPEAVSFINAHGTGTENNDLSESRAMMRLFGNVPAFASTKSNTGHTLGAAGAIEAVYSILNLAHQEVYASLNFKQPIEATGLQPVQSYTKMPLEHVMSNSFGFGGNCASLIFSALNEIKSKK
ncbi:MAG: beta-ketoacyl-[acyl-carrier-protein] synthase family protein [Bacteroidota bacterium]